MIERKISVLVGSLRTQSINRRLADAVIRLAPPQLVFSELRIDDLPPFNQDEEDRPPEAVKRLREEVQAADGVLFVTPEYNRSVPGILKNAIDHASRPFGRNVWARKPAGILSGSIGASGASMAQQHLRNTLAYLDVPTMGQPEAFIHVRDDFFAADGSINAAASRQFLRHWIECYAEWVEIFFQ